MMMSFYSAVGSYQIRTEHGAKMPYIQKLGKLYPLSIPEFVVWSTLLWEVMTYDDLKREYNAQMASVNIKAPELDQMLQLLLKRRLIIKGIGYTGIDALYNMLADAFIIPYRISKTKQAVSVLKYWSKRLIRITDAVRRLHSDSNFSDDEARVLSLAEQTPLSTAELVRCFERNLTDVSSPEKVIEGIYPQENSDQAHIANEVCYDKQRNAVLAAVASLYLRHRILLEVA